MESKDKRYIKEIIEEYNVLLESWGPSDNWDMNQFKTLENLIFEKTKIDVNANTLKRFFQQKTGNPQLATKDALCRFLDYAGYIDFVMKRMGKDNADALPGETDAAISALDTEEDAVVTQDIVEPKISKSAVSHSESTSGKKRMSEKPLEENRTYVTSSTPQERKRPFNPMVIIIVLLVFIAGYMFYTYSLKDMYVDYLISKIEFSPSKQKGVCPFTVAFSYNIPSPLFNDITIEFEEANGDVLNRELNKDINKINATYIYEGEAFCHLKYKDRIIKTIPIECRKAGWSVYAREERKNIFQTFSIEQALNGSGYASLPLECVAEEAHTNHLFVSYVLYKEKLVDADNFVYEARVRNSVQDHAIPCADIIMYIYSDTGGHGFAMNENGYAYMKFISGENTIKGDEYNLNRINFDASHWRTLMIKVANKKAFFYVDGEKLLDMDYKESLGYANELILRFKGCGAVDYVKVSDLDGNVKYEENFN